MQLSTIVDGVIIDAPIYDILVELRRDSNGYLSSIQNKGNYCLVTCPFHSQGRESHPSCGVNYSNENTGYGIYNCFTCGEKGPLWKLVQQCLECTAREAKDWLIEKFGDGTVIEDPFYELRDLNWDFESSEEEKDDEIIDERTLMVFEDYHPYMSVRHLTDEAIRELKIKYDPATDSLVFPNYDLDGNLRHLSRRSVKSHSFDLGKDLNKKYLYGAKLAVETGYNFCCIVESQINAATLVGWHYPAIGMYGAGTTDEQMNVINDLPFNMYILLYDPDAAGIKGAKKFESKLSDYKLSFNIMLPKFKDVNDLSKQQFEQLLIDNDLDYIVEIVRKNGLHFSRDSV